MLGDDSKARPHGEAVALKGLLCCRSLSVTFCPSSSPSTPDQSEPQAVCWASSQQHPHPRRRRVPALHAVMTSTALTSGVWSCADERALLLRGQQGHVAAPP